MRFLASILAFGLLISLVQSYGSEVGTAPPPPPPETYPTCEESFVCTKDHTCAMDEGECRCNDEGALMPVCANPDCPEYCGGDSECKKVNGSWGCHCLPSFNFINGTCVKKEVGTALPPPPRTYPTCKESFICTKDHTCAMDEGECRCNDEGASMPVCANPDCPEYCRGGSECKKVNGTWGCHCLPSFNFINGTCVKKEVRTPAPPPSIPSLLGDKCSIAKETEIPPPDKFTTTICKESLICTNDHTCSMDEGKCRCNDEAAVMPVCANPDCPDYCGLSAGSQCKKINGTWGCQCLPSFDGTINGTCVKKPECEEPDAIVGSVGFAVDNTRSMCEDLDGAKELAKILAKELEGENVPSWKLVTFTVDRPPTDDIKRNTKLVADTPDIKEFINSLKNIECKGGSPDGTTRAMQGIKRILEHMPPNGTVVVITDNKSDDLDLAEDLLRIKEDKNLHILIALAPKYHGKKGDASWKKYVKLSDSQIFQMDKFDKKKFTSAVVKEVENTCDGDDR